MGVEAGEAHEETLFETTCTLYETDPKTASWVSKGTGIIHVNIDKDSDEASGRNSRLSMLPPLRKSNFSHETTGNHESDVEYPFIQGNATSPTSSLGG